MSSFLWNVRGFNRGDKHTIVKRWVGEHAFDFGCILETRVKECKAASIAQSVFPGWSFLSNYEFSRRGRIWIFWKNTVRLTLINKSSQVVTCLISVDGHSEFFCSFVYASNFEADRRTLWRDLKVHHDSHNLQNKKWMIYGDFNEILEGEEHSNYENDPHVSSGTRDFQDLTRYCSLSDLSFHGPLYTWCNKRSEGLVCKKLDRVLVNADWGDTFPHSYCVFEAGGCSDHLRCRIHLDAEQPRAKRPFKFVNVLSSYRDFLPMVAEFWGGTPALFHSTSAIFRLSKKLKMMKPKIRVMGRERLGDIHRRAKESYEDLCIKQQDNLAHPSEGTMQEETEAYNRWVQVATIEEHVLKQRSKMHWLRVGDQNNKSYYRGIQTRQAQNTIREVHGLNGEVYTTLEDIKTEAERHFKDFLQHEPNDYRGVPLSIMESLVQFRCSKEMREGLVTQVTEEEVKEVLFSMAHDKSPGPDGYTTEFYTSAWSIVGRDFTTAIQSFFITGFLPKGVNSTILALIPKKDQARRMTDYRPISCCNVIYKVISKILANRLKCILPCFIAPNQSAFVKDRLLMENLLLATELVKDYHREDIAPRCAIKIDISKAFDSVQWNFIHTALTALNFPTQFIGWIMTCITTASFSIQVNGELAGYFQSKRGLRQGCSLSPYLFVICMNVLTHMIDKAGQERLISYHPQCRDLSLTHLCFADDLMVFSDGKFRSLEGIIKVFDEFAAGSGLQISLVKSTLYFGGRHTPDRELIASRFPLAMGSLPIRYLGLPLLTKRMSKQDYAPLVEKIRTRISSWTTRWLSFAGRLQLISSVLMGLINFWLTAFCLPRGCLDELESLCSAFLWSGPDLNPRKAKIGWTDVCKPKREGGLGLRLLREANQVSCLRLVWRINSARNSLWVYWLHTYLLREKSFWDPSIRQHVGSWMWRKIVKYRELAKPLCRMEVRDGAFTSFWFDNWSPHGELMAKTGARGVIDMGIPASARVGSVLHQRSRRRHRVDLLNQIEETIAEMARRNAQGDDVCLWRRRDGTYRSAFSSKETWLQLKVPGASVTWFRGIWFKHRTPKLAFISWLAMQNRLSTADRMRVWSQKTSANCVLCFGHEETRNHLFFECSFSSRIWEALTRGILQQNYTTNWNMVVDVISRTYATKIKSFLLRYSFQAAISSIWRERNRRKHGEPHVGAISHIRTLDNLIRNRINSIRREDPSYEEALVVWFESRT